MGGRTAGLSHWLDVPASGWEDEDQRVGLRNLLGVLAGLGGGLSCVRCVPQVLPGLAAEERRDRSFPPVAEPIICASIQLTALGDFWRCKAEAGRKGSMRWRCRGDRAQNGGVGPALLAVVHGAGYETLAISTLVAVCPVGVFSGRCRRKILNCSDGRDRQETWVQTKTPNGSVTRVGRILGSLICEKHC